MAVDFWADKYWDGRYFNVRYFGQGEEVAGAMSASLSGGGTLAATLTATGEAVAKPKRRGGGANVIPMRGRRRAVAVEAPPLPPEYTAPIFPFPQPLPAGFMSARIGGAGSLSGELTTGVKGRPKMPAAVHNAVFWALADL
jgi:hypothetical protein